MRLIQTYKSKKLRNETAKLTLQCVYVEVPRLPTVVKESFKMHSVHNSMLKMNEIKIILEDIFVRCILNKVSFSSYFCFRIFQEWDNA